MRVWAQQLVRTPLSHFPYPVGILWEPLMSGPVRTSNRHGSTMQSILSCHWMYASVPSWWDRGIPLDAWTHIMHEIPTTSTISLSFDRTPLALSTYHIIFHIVSDIVHHSYHIVSHSSVLKSYINLTGLYFMSFLVISCHSYHAVYTQFKRPNITFYVFNITFHHIHIIPWHIASQCIIS